MRQLVYQVCYARYQVSFYLWWFRPKRNYKKVPKYYDEDFLKIFFPLYSANDDSTFWKKHQFWVKNVSSFSKQLIRKVERFLKSNFDLNQGYKIVLRQNQ